MVNQFDDALIAELRYHARSTCEACRASSCDVAAQAADRIEQLEKENREMRDVYVTDAVRRGHGMARGGLSTEKIN